MNEEHIPRKRSLNYFDESKRRNKLTLKNPEKNESYHWGSRPLWNSLRSNNIKIISNATDEKSQNITMRNGLWPKKSTGPSSRNLNNTLLTQLRSLTLTTKEQKLVDCMDEQPLKFMSNSALSKQGRSQPTKPINFWKRPLTAPNDWQLMHGFKGNNMMKMQKTMRLEHSNYSQVSSIWKQKSQVIKEKPLVKNLLPCTTKRTTNNECFEQQPSNLPMEGVEEDIQLSLIGITTEEDVVTLDEVEQKTTLEDGDVGPHPFTTTACPTTLKIQHHQTTPPVTSNAKNITGSTSTSFTTITTIHSSAPAYDNSNIQLHYSFRRNSSRRSTSPIYELLENHNESPMALISDSAGLQNPILKAANSVEESYETTNSRGAISCQRSSSEIPRWRYDREVSNTRPKVPFEILYTTGTDEETTYSRLPTTELFYPGRALQDGGSSCAKRTDRKGRLHIQNRFKRCVCRGSYTRRFQRFSQLRKRRSGIQVQVPSLWVERSTKSFLEGNEIRHRTAEERGYSDHILPGRHLSASQDKTRNGSFDNEGETSFREIGAYHQLQKEHSPTIKDIGISGIPIQQQEHDHFSTHVKDHKSVEENQTGVQFSKEVLQMDSRSIGKNDRHDTCSRRSSPKHQVLAERSVQDAAYDPSELRSNLQLVKYQHSRITLVGDVYNTEEWVTNPEDSDSQPEHNRSRRCFKQWMKSQLKSDNSFRILEPRGTTTVDKLTRTEDDTIGAPVPRQKMRRLNYQDIFGQQNSSKIYNQIGRHDVDIVAGLGHSDTGPMQHPQHQSNISTYSRDFEHPSRQIEQTPTTVVRIDNSQENVPAHTTPMGTTENRRICSSPQPPTAHVLVPISGSSSIRNRCHATDMVEEGDVSVLSLEIYSAGVEENTRTEIETSSSDHSVVAQSILVPHDSAHETRSASTGLED